LPVAVFPEMEEDIPPAIDSPDATFRISTPLVGQPAGMVNPSEWMATLAGLPISNGLRERSDAIHQSRRGTVFNPADGKTVSTKNLTGEEFWKILREGGCWTDDLGRRNRLPHLPLAVPATPHAPLLMPPLMTKLYQESGLRLAPNAVALHPGDARAARVEAGSQARLQTNLGNCVVTVTVDSAVPEGALLVGGAPGILDVWGPGVRAKVEAV